MILSSHRIAAEFGFTAVVACELEFYLYGSAQLDLADFWREVRKRCERRSIGICKIEKEKGTDQHEVALMPADSDKAIKDAVQLKDVLSKVAEIYGINVDFSAKPFADEPGSGLHIHLHLQDNIGKNVFYKDDQNISEPLKYSIGGLLYWLPQTMHVFAPHPESYARYRAGGDHTPTTISWGANNRTVAIRLPDSERHLKRIEHRVAGADADPAQVIENILDAVYWGLTNKAQPGEQIYGNANMDMYKLQKLPLSLDEAALSLAPADAQN